MKLLHYSDKPIVGEIKLPAGPRRSVDYKPRGLWVSVEGEYDWKWWCEAEGFRLDQLGVVQEVTLAPTANILHLHSSEELDSFTAKYGEELYPGQHSSSLIKGINWRKVALDYQGIIIAPYIWARRMDLMWYYGWDCASGCIWDVKAIASIVVQSSVPECISQ